MYILKPGFYDDFHCNGGECILTCCQGWKITVEKSVYQKYMEYSGELAEVTKRHMILDTDQNCYRLELNEKGICPYCNDNQLCRLVIEKGEDALCPTCHDFPRLQVVLDNEEVRFLSLGCPTVVEMLYAIKEPLSFVLEEDERIAIDYACLSRAERQKEKENAALIDLDENVRNHLIDILQERRYPLWFRQFTCIYAMDKIKEVHQRGERETVMLKLGNILSDNYLSQLYNGLNVIETDKYRKHSLLKQLFSIFFIHIQKNAREDKYGSNKKAEELNRLNIRVCTEEYITTCRLWEQKEAERFDILMEHAAVCEWFGYALISLNRYYLLDNCLNIMLLQVLIKYSMILYYTEYKQISKEVQVFILSLWTRSISHRRAGMAKIIKDMKEKDILSIDSMFLLLKS